LVAAPLAIAGDAMTDTDQIRVVITATAMNQQALRIIADHSGQRARLIAGLSRP
jgi:hypothetical protein